ncbi:site-specific integrase [Pedobacter gandavensis]|uniref:site-specific integrase n=1 Tax=Pedobacter gandavensis TaxID=2679963 RepID=UPI002478A0C5|nr:site-specific integrase [Pedobacter gandavensis]WGQ10790.1 site-specific integrase [Pedobacter gandavensis]
MATVSAKVFEHHKKTDGTYNVKICVHHKSDRRYFDTVHYVVKKQLTAKMRIKDSFVNDLVDEQLKGYRKVISELGEKINFFTAESLREYLREKDADVDFIKFCQMHIEQLKKEHRIGTAGTHRTVRNSLIDYFKRDSVSITEINSNMLVSYERFLRGKRTMTRIVTEDGQTKEKASNGLSDSGVHCHMRDLRTLFNAACNMYNNEDLGIYRIKHYPFKKYKVGSAPLTKKRNNSLEEVMTIRDCLTKVGSRAELAKEIYMLSFYLCGMNAVDFYHLTKKDVRNGRIDYNRAKTQGRRKDNAFISIKVIEEAKPLLEKYIEKLSIRYSTYGVLDTALSQGMKQLRIQTGIPAATIYWARHTFATVARNACRISKDDVALALNHVDDEHRTTDIYIEKDWSIVDDVQIKVVGLLRRLDMKMAAKQKKETSLENVA